MKKKVVTFFQKNDPSPSRNTSTGCALGQEWYNTTTGDKFYHKSDGFWVKYGISLITVTKTELDILISANELVIGATYKILEVHPTLYDDGTTSGTTIFLQAITNNELSSDGSGIFYNPKYTLYTMWNKDCTWTVNAPVPINLFDANEAVTADNGATAYLTGTIQSGQFFPRVGDWTMSTSITGDITGATANISDVVYPTVNIGEKRIWGGYSWTNLTGSIGTATSIFDLDSTNWSKDLYDETNYNLVIDSISYDYAEDMITKRHEVDANNLVIYTASDYNFFVNDYGLTNNAISVFMWGKPYFTTSGLENNIIENSYFECVDFRGRHIINNSLKSHSAIFGNNYYSGTRLSFNILHDSTIAFNTSVKNSNYFQYNRMKSSSIIGNTLTNNSSILGNVITDGYLQNNTLSISSQIQYNDILNLSRIDHNKMINSCFIGTNYLYDICNITYNIMHRSSAPTSIDANHLTSQVAISGNDLIDSFIQQNKLLTSSSISNNSLTSSTITFSDIESFSQIGSNNFVSTNTIYNIVKSNSRIYLNTISSGSIIENILNSSEIYENNLITIISKNKLSQDSSIIGNVRSDTSGGTFSQITENILDSTSRIEENILGTYDKIISNILNSSNIFNNTFTSSLYPSLIGEIANNDLNSSNISSNQLLGDSGIYHNKITQGTIINTSLNGVNFSSCVINNGGFNGISTISGIDGTLSQIDIRDVEVNTDISAASIIYGDYSKYIFKIPNGNYKLGYYNNSGTFSVQDVDA